MMSEKEQVLMKMDLAAADAEADFNEIPDEHVVPLREWWRKHVPYAGHKRLGRILMGYGKKGG